MPSAVWDITSICNLNCKHCYNSEKYKEQGKNDLSYEDCVEMITFLEQNSFDSIALLGGEPLAHPHIVEILQLCKEKNINLFFTTNGVLLDDTMIKHVIKSSATSIFISLDGADAKTNDYIRGDGVFDIVTTNIINLTKQLRDENSKILVRIAYTIFSGNLHSAKEMVNLCKRLNVDCLNVTPLINSGSAAETWDAMELDNFKMFDAIEEIVEFASKVYPSLNISVEARPWVIWYLRKRYPAWVTYPLGHTKCMVLDGAIYIKADGDLHPCGLYTFKLGKEAQSKGYFNAADTFNVMDVANVGEIYNSKYHTEFLASMKILQKDEYHYNCKSCPVRDDCSPCPYQFIGEVSDCNWTAKKINEMLDNIGEWTVLEKANMPVKFITNHYGQIAFELLNKNAGIRENHEEFLRVADEDISILDYIEILNDLEKKFIIKTNRG